MSRVKRKKAIDVAPEIFPPVVSRRDLSYSSSPPPPPKNFYLTHAKATTM